MSSEPGGAQLGGIEIDGTDDSSGLFIYPTAITGWAEVLGGLFFLGTLGVSDIFYVAADPDQFLVALDPDQFLVAPGRTQ